MAEIDSLEIKISAEMHNASASISLLNKKLNILSASLSTINNKSLNKVADFTKSIDGITKSIGNIDSGKLHGLSKDFNKVSTAVNNFSEASQKLNDVIKALDFSQSIKGVKEFESLFQSQLNSTLSNFGIKGKETVDGISAEMKRLSQSVSSFVMKKDDISGVEKSMQNLFDNIKNNMKIFDESKKAYADLLEYINKTNTSGRKIYLPFDSSEFTDDYTSMRATLGKAFTSDKSAKNVQDLDSYVRELNDTLGTNIQVENNAADTFRNLVSAVKQGRDAFMDYNQAISAGAIKEDDVWEHIVKMTSAFENYSKEMQKIQGDTQENPLSNFVNSMASLKGIKPPNVQWVKTLSDSLENLRKLNDITVDASKLGAIAENLKKFDGIDSKKINGFTNIVERLTGIDSGKLEAFGKALESFSKGVDALSSAKVETQKFKDLVNLIVRLSNINTENLSNIKFEDLGNSIKELSDKISEAKKIEQNTISMTNAIAKLANAGGNIDTVKTMLPDLGKKLKDFMKTMSKAVKIEADTITFTQAIGNLANAGAKTEVTTKNLDALGKALLAFMESLKDAPNVNDNVIQLIQALGGLVSNGSKIPSLTNSMQTGILNFTNSVNRTLSPVDKLIGRLASLFSSMKKTKSSVSGFTVGIKSMGRQILSSMGIYLGFYGAVRGFKNAVKNSMDYIETLNYFNSAFGQVAEEAVKEWKSAGYDSAEAYYNSFSERAKELTSKMTGFNINPEGTLTATGNASLGINPDTLMNYQATFAQMSSSMGITSETSLKLSRALTEIGADLASVKNLDFEDVWQDMASGLAGMSRTLDKYGVNIRNVNLQQKLNEIGITANISALNQNDKALLRTIILLDSTRYAWADLADRRKFEELPFVA